MRSRSAQARDADAIFGPCIDPERSTTKMTSRAAPRKPSRAGGSTESRANPPCTRTCDFTCSPASRQRSTKSRSRGSRSLDSETLADSGPDDVRTACWEQARSEKPPNSSTSMASETFGSNPFASLGGEMREASATEAVSRTTP